MRRINFLRLVAALLSISSATLVAAEETHVVPPDDFVYCTVCHGIDLMGNQNIEAPRLSEMAQWYVEQELHAFKNGWRGTHEADLIGMEMRPMAEILSDLQISDAAQFVNATRSPTPGRTLAGDSSAGKKHFVSCAACHGANGEGNEALHAPALTGIDDWYLLTQLKNYRDGVRGSNPADSFGAQMRASVQVLGDDQAMQDVVRYITSLESN